MPHALIEGPCTVRSYCERFESREWRDGDRVIRTVAAFVGRDAVSALVECAVVEGYLRQILLVLLLQKREGVLVRLFHGSNPEKTEGVRLCLARIGQEMVAQDPACRWGQHTLGIPVPPR